MFVFFINSFCFEIFEFRSNNEWWNVVIKYVFLLDILLLNNKKEAEIE